MKLRRKRVFEKMAENNQNKENEKKFLVVILLVGWIFFIGMLVGRAVGIIATHDDVTTLGEFMGRLDIWSNIGFLGFLILMTIGIVLQNKKTNKG